MSVTLNVVITHRQRAMIAITMLIINDDGGGDGGGDHGNGHDGLK